jgi:hypothetical protein
MGFGVKPLLQRWMRGRLLKEREVDVKRGKEAMRREGPARVGEDGLAYFEMVAELGHG